MKPIVNMENRRYQSPLREGQAQDTRDRILDATARLLTRGLAGLSIPAVAREAGVSIPTVYRNFRTKQDLFEAIYPYAARRAGTGELKPPRSIADFRDGVRILIERFESFDDVDRAAIASRGAEEIRHATIGARAEMARKIADAIAPELSPEDRERLARLVIVLTMSATARMLREHLGRSVDEAVDDIEWAVRTVIAGCSTPGDGE
jgi:AcrR family transcriptional regulator